MTRSWVRYRNVLMDNERWTRVSLRDDDIIISTPPKCGTTWTQMLCALLIFQSEDFPRPLDEMSLWVDALTHRFEDVNDRIEAQRHRRFLKTHTPLDGLPYDDRVTYICVARDPRDAAVSWDNHVANTNLPVVMAMREAAVGEAGEPPPMAEPTASPGERFWEWVESPDPVIGLPAMLHHVSTFWRARHLSNVVLLRYEDLQADLEGQMRALADRLRIGVPRERWPALVRAASFEHMRSHSDTYTPEAGIWHDPGRFFHRGVSGQWRELLGAGEVRRYADRVRALVDDAGLIDWVHHGPLPG